MANFKYKLMTAMILVEILSTIEITMIYAALRFMVEDFDSTPVAVGWTITSFLLAAGVCAAIGGRLGDIYGRKQVLLIIIPVAILGAIIAGNASTLVGVVVGRTLQGITGAIFPLLIGILRENIDRHSLPLYIGILTAIATVSAGLGLLLGGVLVDYLNWRWIFHSIAALGVVALISAYFILPPTSPGQPQPGTNFFGGLLFVPGLVCLMVALNEGKSWGWTNWLTLSLLLAGVAFMVVWVRSELKAKVPLLNIRLVASREMRLAMVATILLALTWQQFGQTWSLLLQQPRETGAGLGLSASMAGLLMQPQTLMALLGGPLAGLCMIRYGVRNSILLGSLVMASSWFAAMVEHEAILFILLLMLTFGVSSAFLFSVFNTSVAQAAPEHRTSEAVGMLTVVRQISNSIGTVIVFYLLSVSTVTGPDGSGEFPDRFSYLLTMGYIAAGSVLIFIMYLTLYKRRDVKPEEGGGSGVD